MKGSICTEYKTDVIGAPEYVGSLEMRDLCDVVKVSYSSGVQGREFIQSFSKMA